MRSPICITLLFSCRAPQTCRRLPCTEVSAYSHESLRMNHEGKTGKTGRERAKRHDSRVVVQGEGEKVRNPSEGVERNISQVK